ncbi:MAG: ATP-grasp domain-containing protein [Candidatus Bathyarchaeia archaeon]
MARVFVTDASQRKAVPIIRSLGRHGIQVVAGESTRWSMGFFSKYCTNWVVYPSPTETPDLFIEWLLNHLKRNSYDALFPIDERTLDPVTSHLEDLRKYTSIPVVDYATYMKARDKGQTIRIALQNDVPCPKTYFVSNLEEVQSLAQMIDFPVVIKPRQSQGSRGIAYIQTRDQLYKEYTKIHACYPFPLIQEFIPPGGGSFGVEILLNKNSEPRAVFVHKRLREYPVSGGPSTLRESVYAPELVELGVRLLKAMGWYGVAMVEFKVDPRDNIPRLMEVNPKFWGSIQLSIVSGVDFPYLLYRMATEGDIEPVLEYQPGVRCRWLLPGDILHFLSNPNRFRLQPSFFQFWGDNLHYDILSRDDPGPIWGMFVSYLAQAFNTKLWKDLRR